MADTHIMNIQSSAVALRATHSSQTTSRTQTTVPLQAGATRRAVAPTGSATQATLGLASLGTGPSARTAWPGARPEPFSTGHHLQTWPRPESQVSAASRWLPSQPGHTGTPPSEGTSSAGDVEADTTLTDPRWITMARMIEAITGVAVRTIRPADLRGEAPASASGSGPAVAADTPRPRPRSQTTQGTGLVVRQETTFTHVEQLRVQAEGVVQMADGRTQAIQLTLEMGSAYAESTATEWRLGGAADEVPLTDPLVIHFSGPVAALSGQRFEFDLNADGRSESMPFVGSGSGFLALDLNGNGRIDDGRELFGPQSGNGFADLAAHDSDGNGWIDGGDAVFERLLVWRMDAKGQTTLAPLSDTGVGALGLASVATDMALYGPSGVAAPTAALGQLRRTGIYLTESGGGGALQHIDLAA